jgi:phosphopantetheinyl transferase
MIQSKILVPKKLKTLTQGVLQAWDMLVWAFRIDRWHPEPTVLVKDILRYVEPGEERQRILRQFHYDDVKRILIGRLLLRRCAMEGVARCGLGDVQWTTPCLQRTRLGRPFLKSPNVAKPFDMNLSHHGNWVVLAATWQVDCVGVDVVCIDDIPGFPTVTHPEDQRSQQAWLTLRKSQQSCLSALPARTAASAHSPLSNAESQKVREAAIDSFLESMRPAFSLKEWTRMFTESPQSKDASLEKKLESLHVAWALKESFLKASGSGLSSHRFSAMEFRCCDGSAPTATTIKMCDCTYRIVGQAPARWYSIDGDAAAEEATLWADWAFCLFPLDETHTAALAFGRAATDNNVNDRSVLDLVQTLPISASNPGGFSYQVWSFEALVASAEFFPAQ